MVADRSKIASCDRLTSLGGYLFFSPYQIFMQLRYI